MDKLVYLTLLILCLLIPVSGQSQNSIDKGNRLFEKKDYENALKAYLEGAICTLRQNRSRSPIWKKHSMQNQM
jgi:hypothetical protein